jgi:hypothetical protein
MTNLVLYLPLNTVLQVLGKLRVERGGTVDDAHMRATVPDTLPFFTEELTNVYFEAIFDILFTDNVITISSCLDLLSQFQCKSDPIKVSDLRIASFNYLFSILFSPALVPFGVFQDKSLHHFLAAVSSVSNSRWQNLTRFIHETYMSLMRLLPNAEVFISHLLDWRETNRSNWSGADLF